MVERYEAAWDHVVLEGRKAMQEQRKKASNTTQHMREERGEEEEEGCKRDQQHMWRAP
jgi:hypothetical protein